MAEEKRVRPKLNANQQVEAMKGKGIRFVLIDGLEAERFLRERNYFFKVKVFEKVFDRYENPEHRLFGQYLNLDFAYLVELPQLDRAGDLNAARPPHS